MELNLYPNYAKDSIRVNPERIPEKDIPKFKKNTHFADLVNKRNNGFKSSILLPMQKLYPMTYMMEYYKNPMMY